MLAAAHAQSGTALLQHAPNLNGAVIVNGSLQQMTGENVTFNGSPSISGDLFVPGTPTVTLTGHPVFGGVIVGTGNVSPSNYSVILNGTPSLGHLRTRTNPTVLPTVSAPPKPTGTRNVTITAAGQSIGSFSTLNNLTLNGNVGQVAIPSGTYGTFTANGAAGFTLGVAGATLPSVYNLQSLVLNGTGQLQILGPVIVTVAANVTINGGSGSVVHPEWFVLNVASGALNINGNISLYAFVTAPSSSVTLNGSSQLIGGLVASQLLLNGNSLLRLQGATAPQPPVANNQSVTAAENAAVVVTLAATQANNDPLTYTAGTASHGTLSGTAPNLTYTPAANYFGADSFTFTAKDGTVVSNTASVSISVTKVNYPPVATNQSVTTAENAAIAINLTATQTNNDTLTYTNGTATHGVLSGTAPNLTYTPATNYFGADSFTFTAKDGTVVSNTAIVSISVTKVNYPPLAANQSVTTAENNAIAINLAATQANNDSLTYTNGTASHGTLSGIAPALTYTPAANFFGADSVTFTAKDGAVVSNTATVSISVTKVNYPPVAANQSVTTAENAAITINLSATQANNDALTYTNGTVSHGVLSGTAPTLTYTPATNYFGADSFTFTAKDGAVVSNTATVSISVTKVNYPPVAANQSVTTAENTAIAINLTATQANNDPLTYINGTAAHGTLSGIAPALTYTPAANYFGTDSFTFTANDGTVVSNVATVTITVTQIAKTALLEIMMPTNGCSETYSRPSLAAHYAGTTPVQPDSFHVYLDGHDFSSEATIDTGEVMFMPLFGLTQGQHNYRVDWVSNGQVVANDNTTFTVNSVISGTFFRSEVRATTGEPLVNIRVVAANQQTFTDSNGKFSFTNLPVGRTLFHFQTSAVTNSGQFTPVNLAFDVLENQNTVWDRPIYLVAFDPSQGVMVQSNSPTAQVITNPALPGVILTIPANTELAFPDGSSSGVVTIVNVPVDRAPNCLGPGFRPSRLISVQPENTILSQAAQLTMPNDLNLPNGAKLSLRNLDVQTGQFIVTGTATVVNNTLVTDAGSGIATFDWGDIGPSADVIDSVTTDSSTPDAEKDVVCSSMSPLEGALEEDHFTPVYRSLGVARSVQLHYNSRVGSPDVVVAADAYPRTNSPSTTSVTASSAMGGSASYFNNTPIFQRFVSSTRTDFSGIPTGKMPVTLRVASYYANPKDPAGYSVYSDQRVIQATTINGAQLYPGLGSGWSIGNVKRLVFQDDGSTLLVDGSKAAMGAFVRAGVSGTGASSNLGFELNSLAGFLASSDRSGPITVVQSLGSVLPADGLYMAQLTVPATSGASATLTLPFSLLPAGTTRISLSVDMLADTLVSDTTQYLTVSYNGTTPRNYGSDGSETVLPGADTGYTRRTGFKRMIIDIAPSNWGQPGNLIITLAASQRNVPYGSTAQIISTAALIDDIRIEGNPAPPSSTFVFSGENGDFSAFSFDPATNQHQRLFKDGSKEIFDQQGRELSSSDRQGNTTTYTYIDATGSGQAFDLATMTDPVGLVTTFTYNGGKLSSVTDPAGRITSFICNPAGQLVKITNPDGTTRSFAYNSDGKMASQSDGKNQTRLYTYGPSGRIAKVQRADGSIYNYTPANVAGFPSTGANNFSAPVSAVAGLAISSPNPTYKTADANGHATSKQLNPYGQPILITDATGQATNVRYDDQRSPSAITRPNGVTLGFAYDSTGNLLQATQTANNATSVFTYTSNFNLIQTSTDPLGRTIRYNYDNVGNLIQITDPLNQVVTMTYNSHGQMLSRTDQRGKTTTYNFDSLGRVISVTDPLGHTTTTSYDTAGNVAAVTDPLGHTTSYLYDAANKPIQVIAPDGGVTAFAYDANKDLVTVTDPLGNRKITTYDVRRRAVAVADALNQTTRMSYDGVDNLIQVSDPAGNVTAYTYDELNRKKTGTDPLGHVTSWFYNSVGNVTKIQRPDGSALTYVYDPLSRLTSAIAPDGTATTNTYDLANQLVAVTDPLNGAFDFIYDSIGRKITSTDQISRTTVWSYDPAGNLVSLRRPEGTTTGYIYDDTNRQVQVTAADGGVSIYAYDSANNPISLTDSNGKTRHFAYDSVNRLSTETDPLAFNRQYSYDVAGNRRSLTRKDGAVINYTYDALNRLVQKNLPAINGLPADTVSLGYDNLGDLSLAADNDSQVTNNYNALSLLTTTTQTFGGNSQPISYSYNALNHKSGMADAIGNTAYTYDSRDRLVQLVDPNNRSFVFAYDALSRITSKADPNGITSTYAYDAASQLLSLLNGGAASAVYTYDNVGRRTAETREDGSSRNFNYDSVDRLLASASSAPAAVPSEAFAYDLTGNWTINSRQHDADNKLISDSSYNYQYDAEGNLTRKLSMANSSDVTSYVYDAENRLVQVMVGSPTVATISYQYDAVGRRIARTANGFTTRYILDGDNVRLELNGSNQVIAANTEAGLDRLLVRDTASGSYFVHQDGLGSTIAVTNSSGVVIERYRYSSYGQISVFDANFAPKSGNIPLIPETFTGREWDSDAGLYFNRARFYSPTMGRFISQDPIGLKGGINYYAYVGNNPISRTDPMGLWNLWNPLTYGLASHAGENPWNPVDSSAEWGATASGLGQGALNDVQGFRNAAEGLGVAAATLFDSSTRNLAIDSLTNFADNFASSECYRAQVLQGIGNNIADTFSDPQKLSQAIANLSAGSALSIVTGEGIAKGLSGLADAVESTAAESSTTTLFRAVSPGEAADALANGLRPGANSYATGKFFAETAENAAQWGKALEGPNNFQLLKVEFPTSTADQFMRWPRLDGIGPARFGTFEQMVPPPKITLHGPP